MSGNGKRTWQDANEIFADFLPSKIVKVVAAETVTFNHTYKLDVPHQNDYLPGNVKTDLNIFGSTSAVEEKDELTYMINHNDSAENDFQKSATIAPLLNESPIVPDTLVERDCLDSYEAVKNEPGALSSLISCLRSTNSKFLKSEFCNLDECSQNVRCSFSECQIDMSSQISEPIFSTCSPESQNAYSIESPVTISINPEFRCSGKFGSENSDHKERLKGLAVIVEKRVAKMMSEEKLFHHIISSQDHKLISQNLKLAEGTQYQAISFVLSGPSCFVICDSECEKEAVLIFVRSSLENTVSKLKTITVFDSYSKLYLTERVVIFPSLFNLQLSNKIIIEEHRGNIVNWL